MSGEIVAVTVHMDKDLKDKADELFKDLRVSFDTAVRLFLCASLRCDGVPFNIVIDREVMKYRGDS